ncbi:uncharacterized protein LOC127494065 [Ctenopharyngodon idella]|uniref:uncharacterized protein LOC127494065 n=1 Tax=Ctenopharyngodon idella TaxID=7959 RepID=UPI002232AC6C|nr:uncharacterized protein LOC127494065 [Ctenopharyngodon idella]
MKANSNAVSEYSSNLISVLNNIAKSNTCSPATSRALTIATATIGNLNKAFQDHCKEVKALKASPQKQRKVAEEVDRDIYGSSLQEYGSIVQQQMPKLLANPERPKTDAASKPFTQVRKPVQGAKNKVLPLERPVTALQKTPKDLQSPSADDMFPPAPVRSFALSNITRSVEKTKVSMESKEETRNVTSFNKMAQEEPQSPAPLSIHHPSPVKSFDLPQISQSVEETKVYVGSMLRTGTSFEGMAQKDLQSPSTHNLHRPSPVKSFDLPQIPQSVEDTKVYVGSMLRTGTSFEGMAQKDLQSPSTRNLHRPSPVKSFDLPQIPQSVEDTKVYVGSMLRTGTSFEGMAQKDLQSPSTRNLHRPSPVKSFDLPQIPQSVEETKVYVGSLLIRGTSFEEMAQKDLLQSVEETKVDVVPVKDLQSPSPVHSHPSSIMKRPQIQTEVKPSLQKPDKPETNKYVSGVLGNSEEDDDKLLHERMKGQTFVIDIEAQESNLKHLDRAFQNNNISSEMYNLCRGNINQTLQSVDLRLGCLLRRYIKHVQLKQLRKTLDENFKLTKNLKDGLAFKKVHSQLCKFDHFQKSVRKVWDAKQASTDETRRWCIARTAHLYQQMNSIHGLHLTGISCVQRHVPVSLLTVTPVRFSTHLCPSPPQRPQTAPSKASPARLPRNNLRVLHSTDATRNISGSFLKISHVRY